MNAPQTDWTAPRPLKLDVAAFETLARSGAFADQYKVELVEGVITAMNAEYRLHGVVKNRLVRRLQAALDRLGSPLEALAEVSVRLDDNNLPQPDAVVARVSLDRDYFGPEDIAIAIEVADSTARTDLGTKTALYAGAGIAEMWVADLRPARLHQFWQPEGGAYVRSHSVPLSGEGRSLTIAGLVVDGSGIL